MDRASEMLGSTRQKLRSLALRVQASDSGGQCPRGGEGRKYRGTMQFTSAIRSGLVNYANFKSRSSRSSYWYWVLFTLILSIFTSGSDSLNSLVTLAFLVPSFAVGIRRMHDINRSGWWILVPIYNIVLACQPGDIGENSYGPPEPPASLS